MINPRSINVIYGDRPREMILKALRKLDLASSLDPSMTVGLKPNLVVPKPSSSGATTSIGLVEGVIEYLKENRIHRIWVMESSGIGHRTTNAFKVTGLDKVATRHGVKLIDLKQDQTETVRDGSFKTRVFRTARKVDVLINMPVVKAHSQTGITCALKNLKGLIPDSEKRRFHADGLHEPIALLNRIITPDLIIADGIQGDLTFEEGGTPVRMDRILIATDPVQLDSFVAATLGFSVDEIKHLVLAQKVGVGSAFKESDEIVELDRSLKPTGLFARNRTIESLKGLVQAKSACSICYGSLLHALERLREKGQLSRLKRPLHVGQGFKGIEHPGFGIGQCTEGFFRFVPGCPPQAIGIMKFIESLGA